MPPLFPEYYRPPLWLRNPHVGTIVASRLRKVKEVAYARERLELDDGDFIDLDWSRTPGSQTALVLVHGLEGSAASQYMRGLARIANQQGWDAVAINLRNCSGEANRLYVSYHSGKSDDLDRVVRHLHQEKSEYRDILIAGFSLGGNLSLKYAGEQGSTLPNRVRALAAISVPTNLQASVLHLGRPKNRLYLNHFLRSLRRKAGDKKRRHPEAPFHLEDVRRIRNFPMYDDLYTAPAHGFRDSADYYARCASEKFLHGIRIPTLLLNAQDDPFLPPECYPSEEAGRNPRITFEAPRYGGHVGFLTDARLRGHCWQELRTVAFFREVIGQKDSIT
ncbi:MAG: alpha/beta fold hydrolase [Bacteroidota bacterium]